MLKARTLIDGIIIIVIVIFLQFFSLSLLIGPFKYLAIYGTGLLLIAFTFYGLISNKYSERHPLDKVVLLFITSMVFSFFMANLYWDQTFAFSAKAYGDFYIYFLYFGLINLKVPVERIERIVILLFFLSVMVFLIDFVTFPDPLFSYRSEERRNGITIFFFGQGLTFLGGFFYLNKFFQKKKIIHLIFFLVSFFCLFMLTQSRMNLIALAAGFFILLLNSDFKKKYLISLVLVVSVVVLYLTSDLFSGIREQNKEQTEFIKEDVRMEAYSYFVTQMQGGIPTMLFGNGVPSQESYLGIETVRGNDQGYWTADVGLVGIFSYFGLLGVVVWLFLFFSVLKAKLQKDSLYLKTYFLAILTTALAGYSIFDPGYMSATVLALYLIRCKTPNSPEVQEQGENPIAV